LPAPGYSAFGGAEIEIHEQQLMNGHHKAGQGRQRITRLGRKRTQNIVALDPHIAEFDAAAFRQSLTERVPVIAMRDSFRRAGKSNEDDIVTEGRPQGDAVGERSVRGESLSSVEAEATGIGGEHRLRVAWVRGAAPEPFLIDGMPNEPSPLLVRRAPECAVRQKVVIAQDLSNRRIGPRKATDHAKFCISGVLETNLR
jgi:hypothetical protein